MLIFNKLQLQDISLKGKRLEEIIENIKIKEVGFLKSLFTLRVFIFSFLIALAILYSYFYILNTKPLESLLKVLILAFIIYQVISYKTDKTKMKIAMFFATSIYLSFTISILAGIGAGLLEGKLITPTSYIKTLLNENKNLPILSDDYNIISYSVNENGILEKIIQLKKEKSLINSWFKTPQEKVQYFDKPIYNSCYMLKTLIGDGLEVNHIIVDINQQIVYQATLNKIECDKRHVQIN